MTTPTGTATSQPTDPAPIFHPSLATAAVELSMLPQTRTKGGRMVPVPPRQRPPNSLTQTATAAKVPLPEAPKPSWCAPSDWLLRLGVVVTSFTAGAYFIGTGDKAPGVVLLVVGGCGTSSDIVDKCWGALAKTKQAFNTALRLYNGVVEKVAETEAKLETERQAWDIEKGKLEAQVRNLGETERKISGDTTAIGNSVSALEQQKAVFETDLASKQSELTEQKTIAANLEHKLTELTAAHQTVRTDLEQARSTETALRADNVTLLQNETQAKTALQEKLTELAALEARLQTQLGSLSEANLLNQQFEQELGQLKDQVTTLSTELTTLKQETSELRKMNSTLSAKIDQYGVTISQLSSQLKTLSDATTFTTDLAKDLRGLSGQLTELRAQVDRLNRENQSFKDTNAQLQTALNLEKTTVTQLTQSLTQLSAECTSLQSQVTNLQSMAAPLKEDERRIETDQQDLAQQTENFEQQKQALIVQEQAILHERQQLNELKTAATARLEELAQKIGAAENQLTELNEQIATRKTT